jgi:Catalase
MPVNNQHLYMSKLTAFCTSAHLLSVIFLFPFQQDYNYLEHMTSFDRERVPERVVHANGHG